MARVFWLRISRVLKICRSISWALRPAWRIQSSVGKLPASATVICPAGAPLPLALAAVVSPVADVAAAVDELAEAEPLADDSWAVGRAGAALVATGWADADDVAPLLGAPGAAPQAATNPVTAESAPTLRKSLRVNCPGIILLQTAPSPF